MNGSPRRILGIDPGLRVTGFGIVDQLPGGLVYIASGVVRTGDGGMPRRLGVIVPIDQQREPYRTRWSRVDPQVAVVVASPYDDPARLVDAAEALRGAGVSLVVMECMGFTSGMKRIVRDVTGVPALLPASVLGRVLAELA